MKIEAAMKKDFIPIVLTKLYLQAVLPTLTEFVRLDSAARSIIDNSKFSLSIGVINKVGILLNIDNGRVSYYKSYAAYPFRSSINLRFLSFKHLNHFFKGHTWAAPILLKGFSKIRHLKKFSQLTDRLTALLLDKSVFNAVQAQLIFSILGKGLFVLAKYDPVAQNILQDLPFGLAEFSLGHDGVQSFWFEHTNKGPGSGFGVAPKRPEVKIHFKNIEIAHAAFSNKLDTLAAIGSQDIKISGLIPLADGLSLIMERVDSYLI